MESRPKHKALLVELLVAVVFFTISQAIVLQVFFKAEQMNRNAQIHGLALIQAESIAETLSVGDDAELVLLALGFVRDSKAYTINSSDGYHLRAEIDRKTQSSGNITTVELKAFQQETELFTLPIVQYQAVNIP